MTYKHLNTRELTLIADFWYQGTKDYRAAKLLQRSQETIYLVYRFLNDGKNIYRIISDISVVVAGSRPNCQLSKLTISMRKSRQVGLLILLLVVMNTQLAAVCAPIIACLPAISMASPLNSYR